MTHTAYCIAHIRRLHRQSGMPIPENRPLAAARVDKNHRELIRRARCRRREHRVDAIHREALARLRPELIRAEAPDVTRLPAESCARRQRRRNLSARVPREPLQPLFRVARRVISDDSDEVDAVLS